MKFSSFLLASLALSPLACASAPPPTLPPPTTAQPAPSGDAPPAATLPVAPVAPDAKPVEPSARDQEGAPGNALTLAMLHGLKNEKGNYFFSATSLRGALGMTALGAKGGTLDEMSRALAIDPDPARNAAAAKAESAGWKSAAGKAELTIANRLWVDKTFALDKTFLAGAESGYGAGAAPVDFAKSPEPARAAINQWVEGATKGKIKDLLPGGSVTPVTRLVLTNAIYFKGSWADAFPKGATKDEAFHAEGRDLNAPTMHREGQMAYADTGRAKVVQLPYRDSDLAMLVVLPQRDDKLASLEADISRPDLETFTKSLSSHKVNLALPKFTFSWGRSVKSDLMALGMTSAFNDKADFTGIAPSTKDNSLYITDVFHKAFVLVDETGTEAAAATGVVMAPKAAILGEVIQMKVDRPFLFLVRNTKTGDVLFAGRVANPKG
jgi:serine protease inhibitor